MPIRLICSTDGHLCLRSATTSFWHNRCRRGPSTPSPKAEIQTGTLPAIRRKPDPLRRPAPRSPLRPTPASHQLFITSACLGKSCPLEPETGLIGYDQRDL